MRKFCLSLFLEGSRRISFSVLFCFGKRDLGCNSRAAVRQLVFASLVNQVFGFPLLNVISKEWLVTFSMFKVKPFSLTWTVFGD